MHIQGAAGKSWSRKGSAVVGGDVKKDAAVSSAEITPLSHRLGWRPSYGITNEQQGSHENPHCRAEELFEREKSRTKSNG